MIETGRPIAQDKAGRQDWLILSDSLTLPASVTKDSLLDSGLFVAELTLPLSAQTLLLEISSTIGWPRTFSLFYEPTVGLVLLHRQGQRVVRHVLPGPFPEDDGQARVCFRFDAPARQWDLSFELLGEDETGLQRPDKKKKYGHGAAIRFPCASEIFPSLQPAPVGPIAIRQSCGSG